MQCLGIFEGRIFLRVGFSVASLMVNPAVSSCSYPDSFQIILQLLTLYTESQFFHDYWI